MKFLGVMIVLIFAATNALADSSSPKQPNQPDELKKFQAQMSELEVKMAFLTDMPLADAVNAAPELILEKAFREAKKNVAVFDQALLTIRAIGSRLRDQGDSYRALKDLGTRDAAIKYAESVSAMSDSLARHLAGDDQTVPDVDKLIQMVNQRRAELAAAFPLLSKRKG